MSALFLSAIITTDDDRYRREIQENTGFGVLFVSRLAAAFTIAAAGAKLTTAGHSLISRTVKPAKQRWTSFLESLQSPRS